MTKSIPKGWARLERERYLEAFKAAADQLMAEKYPWLKRPAPNKQDKGK